MKVDAVLYVEGGLTDEDLTFAGSYLPEGLSRRLRDSGAFGDIYFSLPSSYTGRLKNGPGVFIRAERDDASHWKTFFAGVSSDHAARIFCDSPFLDAGVLSDMAGLHLTTLAEFTFSENLPAGCSCEIISRELIKSLPDSEEKMIPLSEVIRSHINQFDVELFYREPDIRDKRLSFRSGYPREKRIMENLYSTLGKIPSYGEIADAINGFPETLYVGPSYLEIELCGRCDLDCLYCYRKALKMLHPDMEIDLFKKILKDMGSFRLPYSICLGGSGEPLMHENFYKLMESCLGETEIKAIVLETNGIYADDNFRNFIRSADGRVKMICNIGGMDRETYRALHGGDYFDRVFGNIMALRELLPEKDRIFLQIMKINETEPYLDQYYDFWEKNHCPVILQKQNTFLGKIQDRRYSDLSPLERVPCWHLQRDAYILSDGRMGFCKQDIDGDHSRGNLAKDPLQDIWHASQTSFHRDYMKKYAKNPDCLSCDEWYTFNL